MERLNDFNYIEPETVKKSAEAFGTPHYLYDERTILDKCASLTSIPSAYGLTVRYAMKANSTRAILQTVYKKGLKIDASSVNEAKRAVLAGISHTDIMLTAQGAPDETETRTIREMTSRGMKYNVCSLNQLYNIGKFAAENGIPLSMRVHPGVGSGETATRNTGDDYSCFGVHLEDVETALGYAETKGIVFDCVHTHIGSGADPRVWRDNVERVLNILETYFPGARTASFGGGLKEARMPYETAADTGELGRRAKDLIVAFHKKTGRRIKTEIEPGTFVLANAGLIVTRVVDKKRTGKNGMNFIILDGGMEMNARPVMYGSKHPFYIVKKTGELLFSEFKNKGGYPAVLAGRCCESGDSQCLNLDGVSEPRMMEEPDIGDFAVIGGAGAYCAAMSPYNYNSHLQAPEVYYTENGELKLIRRRQTFEQLVVNEI